MCTLRKIVSTILDISVHITRARVRTSQRYRCKLYPYAASTYDFILTVRHSLHTKIARKFLVDSALDFRVCLSVFLYRAQVPEDVRFEFTLLRCLTSRLSAYLYRARPYRKHAILVLYSQSARLHPSVISIRGCPRIGRLPIRGHPILILVRNTTYSSGQRVQYIYK